MSLEVRRVVGPGLVVIALVALVSACTTIEFGSDGDKVAGSGTITTQTRPIGDFNRLVFASEGQVVLSQGDTPGLEIEADDNLQDYLEVETDGPTLTIRTRSNVDIEPSQSIVFRVGAPGLETAVMSGVGSASMNGWDAPDVAITISGTVDMGVTDLRATSLEVELTGVGNLQLSGRVEDQTIVMSGTGSYQAGDLASKSAEVTLSGVGSATVWATDQLRTDLSGTGSVSYYGSPSLSGGTPSGTGSVTALGSK
ncbi:MAG: head GIN domain-containing protein [Acidimicrobiia bacterium]